MHVRRSTVLFALALFAAAALAGALQAKSGKKPDAAAASGDQDASRALLAKVVQALGGAENIARVKDVHVTANAIVQTSQGEMTIDIIQTTVFPDRMRQEFRTPSGTMTNVITPQAAFVTTSEGTRDLPASARDQQLRDLSRSALVIARRLADPKLSLSTSGKQKLGDVETAVLDVNYDGAAVRWYVDAVTGRVLRTQTTVQTRQGTAERVTDYSDFRPVGGLVLAFRQESRVNGEKEQTVEVREIQVNTSPDPKIFERSPGKSP
jgi:hypothetical protein